jgi:glucose/arabinose dehydrogenase
MRLTICAAVLAVLAPLPAAAIQLPPQFVADDVVTSGGPLDNPVAIAFLPGGRLLVAEKDGRVWSVKNGVRSASPMVDLQNEVLGNGDRGLLGIAVDPNYPSNRSIYVLYTVDPDTDGVDTNDAAFGRLARYQVSAVDSNVVDPASRTILMGVTWRKGPCSGSASHTIGSLRWGSDGSLLVSAGEGAQFEYVDAGGNDPLMFGPTRTDPIEDIGSFRAQDLRSLAGKILRIDPATGNGYSSNPYWDGDPTSVRSRVYAYGLRNPFRFAVRPGTGSTQIADGDPGVLVVGDVGSGAWEELDVVTSSGVNLGWPCREGIVARTEFNSTHPFRLGCDSVGTASDPTQPIHPVVSWNHEDDLKSVPSGLIGIAVVSGAFYTGTSYPAAYRRQLFFADYGADWIKVLRLDAQHRVLEVIPFATATDNPVDFATDPVTGDMYYVSISMDQVRRIRYTGAAGNAAPVAIADALPESGVKPLGVTFSSASFDPDGEPLTFGWTFGDGGTATGPSPYHLYGAAGVFDAILTADDGHGGIGRDTVRVTVVSPGGFPSTPVRDAFDAADGPLASPWTDPVYGLSKLRRVSGALVPGCCQYTSPMWGGSSFGPDQEAYVTLAAIAQGAREHDLVLKAQQARYDAAHIEVKYDDLYRRIQVATFDPAGGWVDRGAPVAVKFLAGDRFGARARSNATVQLYRNDVLIGTVSLGTWAYATSGGWIGMTIDGAFTSRLEDFGGGTMNTVGVPDGTPAGVALSPPRPNPSSGSVAFTLTLPRASWVAFEVIDVQGRTVWRDEAGMREPGTHALAWPGTTLAGGRVAPGLYLARISAAGETRVRRVAIVR